MCKFQSFHAFRFLTSLFIAISFGLINSLATNAKSATLSIGTISSDPAGEIRAFTPIVNYLAEKLADDGFDEVKIVIASDMQQMADLLKNQEVDLFIDSSITASIINRLSGSKFMLRRWKKGRSKYRSVIFVPEDSPVEKIDDLKGQVIAFEEPFSTSGYVLPALVILQSGNELSRLETLRSRPRENTVGFIMAYDNETQIVWVERGEVAAAAMSENDYREFSENALVPMRILYVTPFVPYHVVVRRSGLEESTIQRVKEILIAADDDKEGAEVLENFEKTARFDEIPDNLLAEIKRLDPFLENVAVY